MVKSSSGKDGYRSFEVIRVNKHGGCKTKFHGGRYINKTPVGAAKKAFNEFCRVKRIRGVCTLVVSVRETTQGSKNKVFTYKLNRTKYNKPRVMMEGTPNEYLIEYEVNAKAVSKATDCKKPGQTRGRMKKRTARKSVVDRKKKSKRKSKK